MATINVVDEPAFTHARHALAARVLMPVVFLSVSVLFFWLSQLVRPGSSLSCEGRDFEPGFLHSKCHQQNLFLFGINSGSSVHLQRALVERGRGEAFTLVLACGAYGNIEFEGEGEVDRERAEHTADDINAWISTGEGVREFPLPRTPLATALALQGAALAALALVPYVFTRLRVVRTLAAVEFSVGQWPVLSRRQTVPLGEAADVVIEAQGPRLFTLVLTRSSGVRFELGLRLSTVAAASAVLAKVTALLRPPGGAQQPNEKNPG